ncbi:YraN family protein [Pleurocapsales cyanobacterium LEGE 10410]|nr:YraN family protein [Pleurocapsales cyanobacterium LEGE 10410]
MKEIGKLGEELIARWLQIQNYRILQQNWRCRWGEIDLIAQDRVEQAIAFVEVKTRGQNSWDHNGLLAINPTKQQKIWQTASLFLAKYPQLAELPCRFDVGLVSCQKIKHPINKPTINFQQITQLEIGQSVIVEHYLLKVESYLQSAFN